jgi:hypothetical protein
MDQTRGQVKEVSGLTFQVDQSRGQIAELSRLEMIRPPVDKFFM